MKNLHRVFAAASAAFFIACTPALAQWQTPDHSVPIGRGSGTGFKFAVPGTAGIPFTSNGASSDPSFTPMSLANGVTGVLPVANGGTNQSTVAGARSPSGLNIDQMSTTGDANVSIASTTRVQATTTTLTAQRTWTLPAANSVNAGQSLVIIDKAGAINGANTILVARSGSDTINGAISTTITAQYQQTEFVSDGVSAWGYNPVSIASGTLTTLTAGTGIEFSSGATCTTTCTISWAAARLTQPTTQTFLSGSGTYTKPANALWIELQLIGGGGGGGGSGSGPGASGSGGATCWNTSGAACTTPVYAAGGGAGGTTGGGTSGGSVTGSGTCMFALTGGTGGPANNTANAIGGMGGQSSAGGGTGSFSVGPSSGIAAVTNSGGGGSGATSGGTAGAGAGGGAGATCRAIITSAAATYTYVVGIGGAGGAAGGGGSAGGAGAAGQILVIEHYN